MYRYHFRNKFYFKIIIALYFAVLFFVYFFLSNPLTLNAQNTTSSTSTQSNTEELKKCTPTFIGDSLTIGIQGNNNFKDAKYLVSARPFLDALKTISLTEISNTSSHVIIHLGTNGWTETDKPGVKPETIDAVKTELNRIMNAYSKSTEFIFVLPRIPSDVSPETITWIKDVRNKLPSLVQNIFNKKIVDINGKFDSQIQPDKIHLTNEGYKSLGKFLYETACGSLNTDTEEGSLKGNESGDTPIVPSGAGKKTVSCKLGGNGAVPLNTLVNVQKAYGTSYNAGAAETLKLKGLNLGWVLGIAYNDGDVIGAKRVIEDYSKNIGANTIIRICDAGSCPRNYNHRLEDTETIDKIKRSGAALSGYKYAEALWKLAVSTEVPFWAVAGHNEPNALEHDVDGVIRTPDYEREFMNSVILTLKDHASKDDGAKKIRQRINLISPVIDIGNGGQVSGTYGGKKAYSGTGLDYLAELYGYKIVKSAAEYKVDEHKPSYYGELSGIGVNAYLYSPKGSSGYQSMELALEAANKFKSKIFVTETGLPPVTGGEKGNRIDFLQSEEFRYNGIMQFINHPSIVAMLIFNGIPIADNEVHKDPYYSCLANNQLPDDSRLYYNDPGGHRPGCNYFETLKSEASTALQSRGSVQLDNYKQEDHYQSYIEKSACVVPSWCRETQSSSTKLIGDKTEPTTALNKEFSAFYESQMAKLLEEANCTNVFALTCNHSGLLRTSKTGEIIANKNAISSNDASNKYKTFTYDEFSQKSIRTEFESKLTGWVDLPDKTPEGGDIEDEDKKKKCEPIKDYTLSNQLKYDVFLKPCQPGQIVKETYHNVVVDIKFTADVLTTTQVTIPTLKHLTSINPEGTDELDFTPYGHKIRTSTNSKEDLGRSADGTAIIQTSNGGKAMITVPNLNKLFDIYTNDPLQTQNCTVYSTDMKAGKIFCKNVPTQASDFEFQADNLNIELETVNSDKGNLYDFVSANFDISNYKGFRSYYGSRLFPYTANTISKSLSTLKTKANERYTFIPANSLHDTLQTYKTYLYKDRYDSIEKTQQNPAETVGGESNVNIEKEALEAKVSQLGRIFLDESTIANIKGGKELNVSDKYTNVLLNKCKVHLPWAQKKIQKFLRYDGNTPIFGPEETIDLLKPLTVLNEKGISLLCLQDKIPTVLGENVNIQFGTYDSKDVGYAHVSYPSNYGAELGEFHITKKIEDYVGTKLSQLSGTLRALRTSWENANRYVTNQYSIQLNNNTPAGDVRLCYRNIGIETRQSTRYYSLSKDQSIDTKFEDTTKMCSNPENETNIGWKRPIIHPSITSDGLSVSNDKYKTGFDYVTTTSNFPWLATITGINQELSTKSWNSQSHFPLGLCSASDSSSVMCICDNGDITKNIPDKQLVRNNAQRSNLAIYLCQNGMLTYSEAYQEGLIDADGNDLGEKSEFKKSFRCKFGSNLINLDPYNLETSEFNSINTNETPINCGANGPNKRTQVCSAYNNSSVREVFQTVSTLTGVPVGVLVGIWQVEDHCSVPRNFKNKEELIKGGASTGVNSTGDVGAFQINRQTLGIINAPDSSTKPVLDECLSALGLSGNYTPTIWGVSVCMGAVWIDYKRKYSHTDYIHPSFKAGMVHTEICKNSSPTNWSQTTIWCTANAYNGWGNNCQPVADYLQSPNLAAPRYCPEVAIIASCISKSATPTTE